MDQHFVDQHGKGSPRHDDPDDHQEVTDDQDYIHGNMSEPPDSPLASHSTPRPSASQKRVVNNSIIAAFAPQTPTSSATSAMNPEEVELRNGIQVNDPYLICMIFDF